VIVFLADAFALAVLALTVWVINGAHLPLDAVHTLAAQAVAAVATAVVGHWAYVAVLARRAKAGGR
jgi:hypothetical protein